MDLDEFGDIFEEMGDYFTINHKDRKPKKKKGKDIHTNIDISFMESINGCEKTAIFEKLSVCNTCNGSKSKPGTGPSNCKFCSGTGTVFMKHGGFLSIGMECDKCHGQGKKIHTPCNTCKGKGDIKTNFKETIIVPKGINDEQKLKINKKGNYSQGGLHGDLFVKVKIKPHKYFKREQYDIYTTNYISISQAVLGGNVKIRTLNGETSINIEPGTKDGDTVKIANQGITKLPPVNHQKGHHFVKFKVNIPNKLNEVQKGIFEQLSVNEEPIIQNYDEQITKLILNIKTISGFYQLLMPLIINYPSN